jgi:hypothetical protein
VTLRREAPDARLIKKPTKFKGEKKRKHKRKREDRAAHEGPGGEEQDVDGKW